MDYDVLIIGGGLGGLTAAISLSKLGLQVVVLEKKPYPNHKVCGEYVSNEVRPFLESLGLDVNYLGAVPISKFAITSGKGKKLTATLPLGGFGLSRFTFDNALYQLAQKNGASVKIETVSSVQFNNDVFDVSTKEHTYRTKVVLGAFGKRSLLDKSLNRPFLNKKSPWLGVKGHYNNQDFPEDQVALHCFPGGYGGLSKTESGYVNFCYLAHYKNFQKHKNIERFTEEVVFQNPHLRRFLMESTPVFEKPISIAQFSFAKKEPVENHIIMCGDSAGLIHPLCGNGMAMAIHSAKMASECIGRFFKDETYTRKQLEQEYTSQWNGNFKSRLVFGRGIQGLLMNPSLVNGLFSLAPKSESFLASIIKRTHGKPILV